jgi:hypothetical protein
MPKAEKPTFSVGGKNSFYPPPLSHPHALFFYRAFHRFGQAKFAFGGSILGSSQFTPLPQLPLKTMLGLKVVKIEPKIIHLLY